MLLATSAARSAAQIEIRNPRDTTRWFGAELRGAVRRLCAQMRDLAVARSRFAVWVVACGCVLSAGCTVRQQITPMFDTGPRPGDDVGPHDVGPHDAWTPVDVGSDAGHDAPPPDVFFVGDTACASTSQPATLTRVPADIIWVIDNSNSMATAISQVRDGLNGFAAQLSSSALDYRVIMLSQRGTAAQQICVPEPLAGPACADGANFFQIDVNIHSTTPIEQILGTLAQSNGYTTADTTYGGAPWRQLLRDGATRTFVLVSDDSQRTCANPNGATCLATDPPLTDTSLEDFPGGGNPFSSREIGPGILDPSYMGLFDGYTFDAVYAYSDATGTCPPQHAGTTYTTLVDRTHGVRARICDGAAAFSGFFDAIAASVIHGSPIDCNITIPPPPTGMTFQSNHVNVLVHGMSGDTLVPYVTDLGACDATRGGWYYDTLPNPTQILLCPTSCTNAQMDVVGDNTGLDVQFGCQSILM